MSAINELFDVAENDVDKLLEVRATPGTPLIQIATLSRRHPTDAFGTAHVSTLPIADTRELVSQLERAIAHAEGR
jgi:hypothetical protein